MADPSHGSKPLRVLLSEGSSTSAREAITVLGLAGHIVEVCDPSPVCLGRFSRFVSKFHRCPGLRDDPAGYLSFVEKLLAERPFDVLLPIHEQGFVFARVKERFETRVGLALPDFESYRTAHSKAGFSRLLDELRAAAAGNANRDIAERIARCRSLSLRRQDLDRHREPRHLVCARRQRTRRRRCRNSARMMHSPTRCWCRIWSRARPKKPRRYFARGKLLGFHAYRQIAAGAGGGEAIKQSVRRPEVRADVATIGERLGWHGALSVDIIMPERGLSPLYRLQPASGRTDERLSRRARSGRFAAAGFARRKRRRPLRKAARVCGPISPCRRCSAAPREAERGERFFASACVSLPDADPMQTVSRN